jgi:hypothetical protein
MAKKLNIFEGDNHELLINFYYADQVQRVPINYSSIFNKRVALRYSSIVSNSDVGVSFETYMSLAGISRYEDLPIYEVKVKIRNS